MKDELYTSLGLKRPASSDDIRSAYRKLAREYHPDLNPGDKDAELAFKRVSAAYEVLADEAKRKAYDEFGEDSLKSGFDSEQAKTYRQWQKSRARSSKAAGARLEDFDLSELFGFGRDPRAREGPRRGPDVEAVVEVDLRQAIKGGETSFQVPGRRPLTVRIPPGANDGSVIRLRGRGAPGSTPDAPPGDLIIRVNVQPHPSVKRKGQNLHVHVPVSLDEAYNGGVIDVPTFDGPIKLTIPPFSQPGTQLRVRGKGVPRKDKVGDLIVKLDVRLPDVPDDALATAIHAARDGYKEPMRRRGSL